MARKKKKSNNTEIVSSVGCVGVCPAHLGVCAGELEDPQEARAVADRHDGLVVGTMAGQVHHVRQVFIVPDTWKHSIYGSF